MYEFDEYAARFVECEQRAKFARNRPRPCGGPAIMIMRPVNSGAGVPGIQGIGGLPVITGTKDAPLPASLVLRG